MKNIFSKIKHFFSKFRRSCVWFKRMWNNYDFDYNFLMEVIVWKMKDMEKLIDNMDLLEEDYYWEESIYICHYLDLMKKELDCRNQGKHINTNCIWITKDGTQLKIQDMTDNHLKNTIKFLERSLEYPVIDEF